MTKTATYQIGVDVLGFPVFMQHSISEGEIKQSKFYPKPRRWIKVIQQIIKQH